MFAPATTSGLILPCKDCNQPLSDADTNAYQLVAGILYGLCNECFSRQRSAPKQSDPPLQSVEPFKIGDVRGSS